MARPGTLHSFRTRSGGGIYWVQRYNIYLNYPNICVKISLNLRIYREMKSLNRIGPYPPQSLETSMCRAFQRGGYDRDTHHTPTPYPPCTHPNEKRNGTCLIRAVRVGMGWMKGGCQKLTHPARRPINTGLSKDWGGCRILMTWKLRTRCLDVTDTMPRYYLHEGWLSLGFISYSKMGISYKQQ